MSALVSVIIPSYNYGCYVEEAVESALAQTYPEVEILLIDDGSTDNTAELLKRFEGQIRYIRKENGGLSAARNTGIEMAQGAYLALLDADDRLLPDMISHCVEYMETHGPGIGVVGVPYRMIGPTGEATHEQIRLQATPSISWQQFVLRNRMSPLVLVRREVFEKCGQFDPELKSSEDRDMWIRAAQEFEVAIVDKVLAEKRSHGENMSNNASRQSRNMEKVLRKARRGQEPRMWGEHAMWFKAWSVYYFQSALMFWDCEEKLEAWRRLGLSILIWPIFLTPSEMNAGHGFRFKCAVGWLVAGLKKAISTSPRKMAITPKGS